MIVSAFVQDQEVDTRLGVMPHLPSEAAKQSRPIEDASATSRAQGDRLICNEVPSAASVALADELPFEATVEMQPQVSDGPAPGRQEAQAHAGAAVAGTEPLPHLCPSRVAHCMQILLS